MIIKFTSLFLGIIFYLFLYWRKLKEDYLSAQIFSTAFYQILGFFLGLLVGFYFSKNFLFWFTLLGYFLGLYFGIYKFRLKIFEIFEASFASLLILFSFLSLGFGLSTFKLIYFLFFILLFLLVILFFVLNKYYKSFTWYKSGKIGFPGLVVAGLFFMVVSAIALTDSSVLFFLEKKDIFISGIVAVCFFSVAYFLSRSEA